MLYFVFLRWFWLGLLFWANLLKNKPQKRSQVFPKVVRQFCILTTLICTDAKKAISPRRQKKDNALALLPWTVRTTEAEKLSNELPHLLQNSMVEFSPERITWGHQVKRSVPERPTPGEVGGGGTPIYRLYRYVPRNRVWFLRFSVLK